MPVIIERQRLNEALRGQLVSFQLRYRVKKSWASFDFRAENRLCQGTLSPLELKILSRKNRGYSPIGAGAGSKRLRQSAGFSRLSTKITRYWNFCSDNIRLAKSFGTRSRLVHIVTTLLSVAT